MLFLMPPLFSRAWFPLLAISFGLPAHGIAQDAPAESPKVVEPLDLTPPPGGYLDSDTLGEELLELKQAYGRLELSRLWISPEGHPMWLATFRSPQYAMTRPEALIIANLEGDRPIATEMAMALIRDMASTGSPWAQAGTLHILPVGNPDAYARVMAGMEPNRGAGIDEDRDGRIDEDGPSDLDGDGRVLWVRIRSKTGKWYANPSEKRAMEPVESGKEPLGAYLLRREGADADGDRQFGEDPVGGIRVDSNFPHRWPQYTAAGGAYPMSEAEASSIAGFVLGRKKLAWVLVLDDEDNLAAPPKGVEKFDPQATEPMASDAVYLKAWGERLYPKKGAKEDEPLDERWTHPVSAEHGKGNFADWVYYQRGLFVLESAIWTLPTKGGEDGASDEWKRLQWADQHYKRNAFAHWRAYEHPDQGKLEIGGWFPLVKTNPPAEWLADLGVRYVEFVDRLALDFAQLEWTEVQKTPLAEGVFEIRATLANVGFLPTSTAMGLTNRAKLPILVELRLPEEARLLVGQTKQDLANLPGGGGSEELRWIVQLPAESPAPVLFAICETAGEATYNLE